MDWRDMQTVPPELNEVVVRTAGGWEGKAIRIDGLIGSGGADAWGWGAVDETDYPESWTDGVCWEVNEDGERSDPPIAWRLP